jgi:hypothetical protein
VGATRRTESAYLGSVRIVPELSEKAGVGNPAASLAWESRAART